MRVADLPEHSINMNDGTMGVMQSECKVRQDKVRGKLLKFVLYWYCTVLSKALS